jgi:hypothetical protein
MDALTPSESGFEIETAGIIDSLRSAVAPYRVTVCGVASEACAAKVSAARR